MEEKLVIWIKEQRQKKLSVNINDIKAKAKLLQSEIDPDLSFAASNVWF